MIMTQEWLMLESTQEALREHMALLNKANDRIAELLIDVEDLKYEIRGLEKLLGVD